MVKKISRTVLLIIAMVLILVTGNQVALRQYQVSSDHLLQEYHEMHALQEFKLALTKFQNFYLESKDYHDNINQLDFLFGTVKQTQSNCTVFVTEKHFGKDWSHILEQYNIISSINYKEYSFSNYETIKAAIGQILLGLDNMILETKDEIDETENRNNTLLKHSTLTLLTFGIIIVIAISAMSIATARGITKPIGNFLSTFRKISSGDRNVRVNIEGEGEFRELATEFNKLFDQLENTTVTLEYFRNIIDSIYGALFVTDNEGHILSYNKTVTTLLGYNETELLQKDLRSIFSTKFHKTSNGQEVDEIVKLLNKTDKVISRSGKVIPTLTTCTSFETNSEVFLITVVHDITEKLAFEKEIEETKRKSTLAINAAQEAERTRIATELHDSLGQKLSAISYAIQDTYDCIEDKNKINVIQHQLSDAIAETRTISHSIMPGVLKDFGLCAAVKELVTDANKINKISFSFNKYDLDERLDSTIEKVLYRISQEAINNILKHSSAKTASIQLFYSEELITLMVEDDGIGFDPAAIELSDNDGIGLLSIQERIASYNGEFTLNTSPGRGTEIIIEIPHN